MAPADSAFLGVPGPWLQSLLLLVAGSALAIILRRRVALLLAAAPDPRLDGLGSRLRALLVVGVGQSRQPRYPVAGLLHIVIFFGFLILTLRSVTLMGEAYRAGFADIGSTYAVLKDWTALAVLVACVIAALRRAVAHPARYHDRNATGSHGTEAYLILALIALLMVADAAFEGSELTAGAMKAGLSLPLASAAAVVLSGASAGTLETIHLGAFWVHNTALLFFACYLPVSKHFHVITALPNVFLHKRPPGGRVKPPRHDQDDLDALDTLGVGRLEDFTWKHLLDFYSCTDCGRCSDHCPAYATGTPLSPRQLSIKCRDAAYAAYPVLGRPTPPEDRPALLEDTLTDGEIWACTTCGACEEACPVLIEYVDKVVDLRRRLVDDGRVPAKLKKAMADLEKRGNPYGKPARKRDEWIPAGTNGGGVRPLDQGDETDLLWFADSAAAFDPRIRETAVAFAGILEAAGMDVGTLGRDEVDSGHEARRLGEEGLFQALREQNHEAMSARRFRRVVSTDPHAFNGLRHDYDLEQPVLHHSQVLAEIVETGRVPLGDALGGRTLTFHDPCYLCRHNGIVDAPRRVLGALPGTRLVEMERSRNRSFCCGGGSLYLFLEGECERRMGEVRVEMAEQAGADLVVTACPYCLINLDDAIKTSGRENSMEVLDLAEVVHRCTVRSA